MKCLLIHYPLMNKSAEEKLARDIKSLEEGFAGRIAEIRPVPISRRLGQASAEDFNFVIAANEDCDMIISQASLPYNMNELLKIDIFKLIEDGEDNWVKDPEVKYPILVGVENPHIGYCDFLVDEGLIQVVCIDHPKPGSDKEDVPGDVQEAFDKKFLIITPENIEEIRKKYPKIFPKVK